jgi:hypothetical protein
MHSQDPVSTNSCRSVPPYIQLAFTPAEPYADHEHRYSLLELQRLAGVGDEEIVFSPTTDHKAMLCRGCDKVPRATHPVVGVAVGP